MVKIGDEGGVLTWAAYNRWPLYGFILAILGAIGGFFFGSISGALIGLVGGLILGLVIGFALGRDRLMFPVILEKWAAYGGGAPSYQDKFVARVVNKSFESQGSAPALLREVQYLDGWNLRTLPNYSLPTWIKIEETKKLMVLQVDSQTYLPMIWDKGRLIVDEVPQYAFHDGVDANGNQIRVFEKDEKGNNIVVGKQKLVIFDTTKMIDQGYTVDIPVGATAKLDNERGRFTQRYRLVTEMYKYGGFWERYGHMAVAIISIFAILAVVIFGLIKFGEASKDIAQKTADAQLASSQQVLEGARLNAQIASALLSVGFHYNATFYYGGNSTPAVESQNGQPQPIKIPFIG